MVDVRRKALEEAAALCKSRADMHRAEVEKWPLDDENSRCLCLADALEAMECALAIKQLIEKLDSDEAGEAGDG